MLYYSYTLMFSLFTALLLCCCVSFCSLLDGVCLSGNKKITYLLTYLNSILLVTRMRMRIEEYLYFIRLFVVFR